MHRISEPSILYFGTPVILISTTNENHSFNLAPISSVFWLGWRCVIGISASSRTFMNILRTGQCVVNLPSAGEAGAINKLARTTGTNPVPESKKKKGYFFEPDKFTRAGLTAENGDIVSAPLVKECPVQLEAVLVNSHSLAEEDSNMKGRIMIMELRIIRVHLEESILKNGHLNHIDPDKWRPVIMSFQKFYGLTEEIHPSTLSEIPEELYKTADIEKTRDMASFPAVAN